MTKILLTTRANSAAKIDALKMAHQGKCLLKFLLKCGGDQPIDKPDFEKALGRTQDTADVFGQVPRGNVITGYQWYLSKKFKKQGLVDIIRDEPAEPSKLQGLKDENQMLREQLAEALKLMDNMVIKTEE